MFAKLSSYFDQEMSIDIGAARSRIMRIKDKDMRSIAFLPFALSLLTPISGEAEDVPEISAAVRKDIADYIKAAHDFSDEIALQNLKTIPRDDNRIVICGEYSSHSAGPDKFRFFVELDPADSHVIQYSNFPNHIAQVCQSN